MSIIPTDSRTFQKVKLKAPAPPCVIFEDDDLLVVNKPAGLNTHAPSPYAGEGLYDWLRHREPRWASLAIIHRLDKETSGVLVFAKTPRANRSLTEQFTQRTVIKKYPLLTERKPPGAEFTVVSSLVRVGDKYASGSPVGPGAERAETHFRVLRNEAGSWLLEASPRTGRTHQIRVHAAEKGCPVLGDVLYGGAPAARVCLHASELVLNHPATRQPLSFSVPCDFAEDARLGLRAAIIEPEVTNAWRVLHGASDAQPNWYLDKLGDWLLSAGSQELDPAQKSQLAERMKHLHARGAYHQADGPPVLALGEVAPSHFTIRENGVFYALSFQAGASVGLFLDQRDNRRRLLTGHVAAGFPLFEQGPTKAYGLSDRTVLNLFAYTCGFSVCAALSGARTTSVDLSRAHLEWGRRNFNLNQLDTEAHEFIYGDAFDWLGRLRKKRRVFDVVIIDPPTFSRSKESGVFRAERDYGKLVVAALPLLEPGGVLFASTNAADWPAAEFLESLEQAIGSSGRPILARHFAPQPPDFPSSRAEKAHLKTAWLRVGAAA